MILAALAGLFLWRGGLGLFPVEREITWHLWGDFATIRQIEVQLYDGDQLLKREQLSTPTGAGFEPTSKLQLKEGDYRGLVMIWRADAGAAEVHEHVVHVDDTSGTVTVP
ncbi:MAG: hypothetical protein JNK82_09420 [Myxococcaceae bacterium]|nr:hypothetical protein [Myxococcaceae bacterium]